MNISPVRDYNNESYNIFINIESSDVSLSFPKFNKLEEEQTSVVLTEGLASLVFENSITDPIPKIEIEYHDKDFILTPYLKNKNTRLHIKVTRDRLRINKGY